MDDRLSICSCVSYPEKTSAGKPLLGAFVVCKVVKKLASAVDNIHFGEFCRNNRRVAQIRERQLSRNCQSGQRLQAGLCLNSAAVIIAPSEVPLSKSIYEVSECQMFMWTLFRADF